MLLLYSNDRRIIQTNAMCKCKYKISWRCKSMWSPYISNLSLLHNTHKYFGKLQLHPTCMHFPMYALFADIQGIV